MIALARWDNNPIIIYGKDREIIYYNKKGLVETPIHVKNLEAFRDHLLPHTINVNEVYDKISQVYNDLRDSRAVLHYNDGRMMDLDIYPSLEGYNLSCVVVAGRYICG
jgi:hypothetical protein